jgi:hypothetical protein
MAELPDPPRKRRRGRPNKVELPPLAPIEPPDLPEPAAPEEPFYPDPVAAAVEDPLLTDAEREQLRAVLDEFARREMEALALFEGMEEQERFLGSHADERVGLGGNRGGKTTAVVVEVARAATGQDPHDKYPKENGRIVLVGRDQTQCAKVFYKKLFKPGAFQIIKDAVTGKWRVFRPNDPEDEAREDEARPAPPLISPRFYDFKRIAWENKKEELPNYIPLKNGWEIYLFSSLGIAPQGWDVDLVAFDEEIEHPTWYPEMSARLLDRRKRNRATGKTRSGKFIWSATPQAGTVQLYQLCHRAEEEEGEAEKTIEVFRFGMLDNPYVSDHAKRAFIRKFRDDEQEYRVRVLGHFALLGTRVYGEFLPRGPHGCDPFPVPHEWTRYASVDPGRQVCAVLFAACPPTGHPDAGRVYLYDELYIKRANAEIVAEQVRAKLGDQHIAKWYIDARGGRITEIGSGVTPEEQYRRAFVKQGIFKRPGVPGDRCAGFLWSTASGGDDIKAGIEAVRLGLHLDEEGRSKWVVFRSLKNFLWEAEIYSYRRLPNGLVTDEVIKANDHLMDNWRYLACARLKYVKAKPRAARGGYTTEALKAKKERARARAAADGGFGDSILLA